MVSGALHPGGPRRSPGPFSRRFQTTIRNAAGTHVDGDPASPPGAGTPSTSRATARRVGPSTTIRRPLVWVMRGVRDVLARGRRVRIGAARRGASAYTCTSARRRRGGRGARRRRRAGTGRSRRRPPSRGRRAPTRPSTSTRRSGPAVHQPARSGACPTTTMFTARGRGRRRIDRAARRRASSDVPASVRTRGCRAPGRGRTPASGRKPHPCAGCRAPPRRARRRRRDRDVGRPGGRAPHGSPFSITPCALTPPATLDAATTPRWHASAASRARCAGLAGRGRRRRPGAAGRCTASRCARSRRRSSRRRRARRRGRRRRPSRTM